MGVVLKSGVVESGNAIRAELLPVPHIPLDRV